MNIDTLIHAKWIIPVEPENTVYENYALAIKNDKIIALLGSDDARKKFTATEELILEPGLTPETIIKHLQSYQSLRAKGFVQTSQGPRLLQGVGTRIDLVESSVSPPAHLLGRIVIIRRSTESDSRHN